VHDSAIPSPPEPAGSLRAVAALFAKDRATVTALLWACLFLTMISETFLVSWLPTLLGDVVAPMDRALWLSSFFSLGGIAAVFLLGSASDRFGPWQVVVTLFVLSVVFATLIGLSAASIGMLAAAIALAGFCLIGAHHLVTVLATTLYPTNMRTTGTSWAVAVGRVGSILGPLIGGLLIGWHWPLQILFPTMAAFAAVAGVTAFLLGRSGSRPMA
jgi:AAHS family 4-hydroxybenzoate transporter-like MFS transporter